MLLIPVHTPTTAKVNGINLSCLSSESEAVGGCHVGQVGGKYDIVRSKRVACFIWPCRWIIPSIRLAVMSVVSSCVHSCEEGYTEVGDRTIDCR